MSRAALPSSFRDPSGFVFVLDGVVHRQVNDSFRAQFDALHTSGLYDALVGDGLLIPHDEVDPALAPVPADAYKVLRPEPVDFISYPYEWCPGQLRAAALTTIRAQRIALDHGMSLRDASAYNVQFHRGRPVLIDTLSFEPLPEGRPWVAYRQFCQHFLAPLALIAAHGPQPGRLSQLHLDGLPLDLVSALLPARTRLKPGLLTHIHVHAKSQRRYADRPEAVQSSTRTFSLQAFRGLVESLASNVASLSWELERTTWSDYYAEAGHYTDEAMADKERLVAQMLDQVAPARVWDLGANTGRFSRVAAARGVPSVAFDVDHGAVEANWRAVETSGETNVLPLVMDLTNPSPALGWAHEERMSLAERGPVDLALALALVHHLAIGNNVPLEMVARFFARIARRLVIEFVLKSDPKVALLLASREDIFPHYTQDGFERAFSTAFTIDQREPIGGSERTLYLMTANATDAR